MNINKHKGSLATPLPMVFLLLSVALIFIAIITMSNALTGEVEESFSELSRTIDSKSYSEDYFFNYITRGAEYSVNQKAYELGTEGGGVSWSSWDENMDKMDSIRNNFVNEVNSYFEGRYVDTSIESINCELRGKDFQVEVSSLEDQDSVGLGGRIRAGEDVVEECTYADGNVVQEGLHYAFLASYEASYNRYLGLAEEATDYLQDLKGELVEFAEIDHTSRQVQCGCHPPKEEVKQDAIDFAESELDSLFGEVTGKYPQESGFNLDSELQDREYETEVAVGLGEECDCEEGACDRYHVTQANATLSSTAVSMDMVDEGYRVLTEGGWEHLNFRVDDLGGSLGSSSGGNTETVSAGLGDSSSTDSGSSSSGTESVPEEDEQSASDNGGTSSSDSEESVVIHFSPTSNVDDFQQRVQAYQSGIEEHTPFGDRCPIEYQTDNDGSQDNADIVFTVSHEYSNGATAKIQSTHITGRDRASGTLYAGLSQGGVSGEFSDEIQGASAAHETLHEFGMCEEYSEEAWQQGENQIYNDVGGCVNPWDRPKYSRINDPNSQSQCSSEPTTGESDTCGTPTEGGYSIMGTPNIGAMSGSEFVQAEPSQSGVPEEDVEALVQFIEEHAGVTCQ